MKCLASLAGVAAFAVLGLFARTAQSQVSVNFDNQFNGTWATSDGNPIATYTPNNVGDTFSNNSDADGATWTVTQLTPQPWNIGGVIFAGGGNTTGTITTEIATQANTLHRFGWDTDLLGAATTHQLTATAYEGSGTGGAVLGSQTFGTNANGHFAFASPGGPVTLAVTLSNVGTNASSDIQLNFAKATSLPVGSQIVFDNQFNGTWATSDGNPISTYTPNNVGDTFSNNSDANGATWTVTQLTPQPWNLGGVIFAGGGNTTGTIETDFATQAGATYTVEWDADLLGNPTTHQLTATIFDELNNVIASQTSGTDDDDLDDFFTFVGTGDPVSLVINLSQVGTNGSSDIQLDFVTVSFVAIPEPASMAIWTLLGCIGGLGAFRYQRRIA